MSEGATETPGRRYLGLTADERARRRRSAILDAALELFGTSGYAANSVKQVCTRAGLTERYFYESFTDREDCLRSLYDGLIEAARSATLAAVEQENADAPAESDIAAAAAAGLGAFIGHLTADPRRARVVLVEVVGVSAAMEQRRHRVLREFADIVVGVWADRGAHPLSTREELTAVALVGAVNHLLVDWLMDGRRRDISELVAVCTDLFTSAFNPG